MYRLVFVLLISQTLAMVCIGVLAAPPSAQPQTRVPLGLMAKTEYWIKNGRFLFRKTCAQDPNGPECYKMTNAAADLVKEYLWLSKQAAAKEAKAGGSNPRN